ncbi:MAG TPA: hypothetical protein VNV88_13905 [Candidatus Solibacter sp.]|jgi:hypothetical protein|nr:hypothetical protein [Candidatus Solibacter sp.]
MTAIQALGYETGLLVARMNIQTWFPGHPKVWMLLLGICSLIALLGCAAWYGLSIRHNRRKAVQALRWIEAALSGQGQVSGIRWLASSRFRVPLRFNRGTFLRAWILVELSPCEMPLTWMLNRIRKRQDLLVFQADLDLPPRFSLDVYNLRWFARTTRKEPLNSVQWNFEHAAPFIISTRTDWQKDISSAMTSLVGTANREFLNVNYQKKSPHFSVTLPLEAFAPNSPARNYVFETMRELAGSSSASLF